MGKRAIQLKPNTSIATCPKCGNNERFTAHSNQFAEDCCDVWVICKCGYDPTEEVIGSRMDDVWGSLDPDTVGTALRWCWNDPISKITQSKAEAP